MLPGAEEQEQPQSSGKGHGCHRDATCPARHGDFDLSLPGKVTHPRGTGQSPPPAPRPGEDSEASQAGNERAKNPGKDTGIPSQGCAGAAGPNSHM